jgi:RNA polymerase sigma factor (sigma-70 family)
VPLLQKLDSSISRDEIERIVEHLPPRVRRAQQVPLDVALDAVEPVDADLLVVNDERRRLSAQVANILRRVLASLDDHDRLALQLRFETNMTVATIARILGVDQKPLYRRMESLLRRIRQELEDAGIKARDVDEIIGSNVAELDFGMRRSADTSRRSADIETETER